MRQEKEKTKTKSDKGSKFKIKSSLNKDQDYDEYSKRKEAETKVFEFTEKATKYLGIPPVLIEFTSDINCDASIVFEPTATIRLNSNMLSDLIATFVCISHKLRHLYQLYCEQGINDTFSNIIKEELIYPRNNEKYDNMYILKEMEIDAEAFAQIFIKENYNIDIKLEDENYQKIIDDYKLKNKDKF